MKHTDFPIGETILRTLIYTVAFLAATPVFAQSSTPLPQDPGTPSTSASQATCIAGSSSSMSESSGCLPALFAPADGSAPHAVLLPAMYVYQQGGSAPVPPAAVKLRELQIGAYASYVDPDYGRSVNTDVGVYASFSARHFGVEADAADTVVNRGGIREAYAVIGPRFQMPYKHATFYVKAQAGAARFNGPSYETINNRSIGAVEQYGGGVELNASRHLKIRLADYSYQVWPEFSVSNLTPYHISSGVALRF